MLIHSEVCVLLVEIHENILDEIAELKSKGIAVNYREKPLNVWWQAKRCMDFIAEERYNITISELIDNGITTLSYDLESFGMKKDVPLNKWPIFNTIVVFPTITKSEGNTIGFYKYVDLKYGYTIFSDLINDYQKLKKYLKPLIARKLGFDYLKYLVQA